MTCWLFAHSLFLPHYIYTPPYYPATNTLTVEHCCSYNIGIFAQGAPFNLISHCVQTEDCLGDNVSLYLLHCVLQLPDATPNTELTSKVFDPLGTKIGRNDTSRVCLSAQPYFLGFARKLSCLRVVLEQVVPTSFFDF